MIRTSSSRRLFAGATKAWERDIVTDWSSVKVTCPYYMGEREKSIACEGITSGTKLNVLFASKERKKSFKRDNCESFRRTCPIHQMLEEKYERI